MSDLLLILAIGAIFEFICWGPPKIERVSPCMQTSPSEHVPPFTASEYLQRMEDYYIHSLETRNKPDWTITLWWGLDGLRIAEDGAAQWIQRGVGGCSQPLKSDIAQAWNYVHLSSGWGAGGGGGSGDSRSLYYASTMALSGLDQLDISVLCADNGIREVKISPRRT